MKALRIVLLGLVIFGLLLMPGCKSDNNNGGYRFVEYYPLGQGDTWSYSSNGDSWQQTVSGTETIDGVQAVKLQDDSGGYILLTNTNGRTVYKEYQQEDGGWWQILYSPPLSFGSSRISVGDRYTFSSTMTYSDSAGFTDTGTISGEVVLEGFEDVTVPAGTFSQCLKLKATVTFTFPDGSSAFEVTIFLAKGVGEVKNVDLDAGVTETTELQSATVGGVNYP